MHHTTERVSLIGGGNVSSGINPPSRGAGNTQSLAHKVAVRPLRKRERERGGRDRQTETEYVLQHRVQPKPTERHVHAAVVKAVVVLARCSKQGLVQTTECCSRSRKQGWAQIIRWHMIA